MPVENCALPVKATSPENGERHRFPSCWPGCRAQAGSIEEPRGRVCRGIPRHSVVRPSRNFLIVVRASGEIASKRQPQMLPTLAGRQ